MIVGKDNDTGEEWDFDIELQDPLADDDSDNLDDGIDFFIDEITVTVLDADAPVNDEDSRSEDVLAAIERAVASPSTPVFKFGAHTSFDELTLTDLKAITALTVYDNDDDSQDRDDSEPLEELRAGDFEGLIGLTNLTLVGAGSLPSGVFAGVGSDLGDDGRVIIEFQANKTGDDDVAKVGNFKPSTLPAHIFADQESKQVIVLADDLNDKDEGTTGGLDAGLYAAAEDGHFFVMTNAATAQWVLGTKVDFGDGIVNSIDLMSATVGEGGGKSEDTSRAIRFAIGVPDTDDDARSEWLFLFDGTVANDEVINASFLLDIAVVEITEKA